MKSVKVFLAVVIFLQFSSLFAAEDFLNPYEVDENTVLLLHFDGDSTNASDQSGDAVSNGNTMYIAHDEMTNLGQYVWLDNDARSDSSFFTVADNDALDLDSSWTVECWAKQLTVGEHGDWHTWSKLVSKPSNWWMGINGHPDVRNFQSGYETTKIGVWKDTFTPNGVTETGKWYHIAAIFDINTKVYSIVVHDKEGNLVSSNSVYNPEVDFTPMTNNDPVQIGFAYWWPDSYFNGLIDEVRISNCVRNFNMPPEVVADVIMNVEENTSINVDIALAASSWEYANVNLNYSTTLEDNFTSIAMTSSDNVHFSADIPAQPAGTSIKYYITAENTDGDIVNSMFSGEESDTAYFGIAVGYQKSLVLDMDFEQNITDATGINNVVSTGEVYYSTNSMVGDYSIHFTPVATEDDTVVSMLKVEKPAPFLGFDDGYTMEVWVNPDTLIPWSALLGKYPEYYNDGNDWKFNYRLYFHGQHLNKMNIENYYSNTVWQHVYLDDTDFIPGQWYKIVAQFSAEKSMLMIELFDEELNLIESNWQDCGSFPLMTRAGDFSIGGDAYDFMADVRFQGLMDGLKIYNYAAALPPTLESGVISGIERINPGEEKSIDVTIDNAVTTTLTYSINGGAETVVDMTKSGEYDFSSTIAGQTKGSLVEYSILAVNSTGKELRLPGAGSYILKYMGTEDMVLSLDFEEGTGVPVDASEYNHELSVIGAIEYSDDALVGNKSLYLENDSSYIQVDPPAAFLINDEMTIEISFNADEIPSDGTDLISKYPDPGDWAFGFRISFQGDGKLFPEFFLVADEPGTPDGTWNSLFLANDTRISAGNWYTFTMEVGDDSARVKLFDAEGNLLDSNVKSVAGQHLNPVDGVLSIGHRWDNYGNVFQGKLDNIKLYNYSKTETEVSIDSKDENQIPIKYELSQNYPNPFNPTTRIVFTLPETQSVRLNIYNMLGQKVKTLVNTKLNAGAYSFDWDATNNSGEVLSSGIYFYRLQTPEFTKTHKMMFIR